MNVDVHIGTVTSNDQDPEKEFGIEVRIDSIDEGSVYPELVYPFFQPNFFKVPDVGEQVLVVIPADLPESSFQNETTALNEFADAAFYLLRGFDNSTGGGLHPDMKTNYPKRCGWWLRNGTIILIDETPKKEEIWIRLTDGQNGIRITSQGLALISNSKIRLGDIAATEAAVKGTQLKTDLTTFLNSWNGLLTTLSTSSMDAGVIAYANAMKLPATGPIATLLTALAGWLSQKTFLDL